MAASLAEDVGGLPAVAWLAAAVRLAIVAALWGTCRMRATTLPAIAATAVGVTGSSGAWDVRPQLVGLLFFVIVAAAAWRSVDDGRPRWWLIPLTWVWAMSHGTWVLGVVTLLVTAMASLVDRRSDPLRQHVARFAVPVGMAAIAALTPVGPRLYTTLTSISEVSAFIQEWQPVSLREAPMAVTFVGVGVVVVSWIRGWVQRPSWGRISLLAFAAVNALMYGRTIAVAAILTAPLLAEVLQAVVPRRGENLARVEALALSVGVLSSLTFAAIHLPTVARLPGDAPNAMSSVLESLPSQVVFNEEGAGGWLHWKHPQLTPVIDTRWEVYGRDSVLEYGRVLQVAAGWEAGLDRTGTRLALLKADSPLAVALQAQRQWDVLSSDSGFVLLSPR
nr:hypothetical protein [Propionibacterium sp.]